MAGSWLMISDLDGTFLNSSGKISSYSRRALARMIREGAKITFASARTCATIGPMLNGLVLPIPVIIMNGRSGNFRTDPLPWLKLLHPLSWGRPPGYLL